VEAMSQQYIQLRPLGALGPSGEDDADDNYFMYDDDDNYQYEVSPCTALSCCHVSFAVCHDAQHKICKCMSSTWDCNVGVPRCRRVRCSHDDGKRHLHE
jgi:hypothetical protein